MFDRLFESLEQRFDDIDEVKDIARHGCSGGVNGFIYSWELREFFFNYEDEIEELMYEHDVTYADLTNILDGQTTIMDYIQRAVWYAVEHWACDKVYTLENELSEEYALANAY